VGSTGPPVSGPEAGPGRPRGQPRRQKPPEPSGRRARGGRSPEQLGNELRAAVCDAVSSYGTGTSCRIRWWWWRGLPRPELTPATTEADGGVRVRWRMALRRANERSDELGMFYAARRVGWTRPRDQMVTGSSSAASPTALSTAIYGATATARGGARGEREEDGGAHIEPVVVRSVRGGGLPE
jgi:hypothetical protein